LAKAGSEIALDQEGTVAPAREPMQSLHIVLSVGADK
jgi:hypothetical protein